MALTKVTKSGITDNAVDADKIEDGTIVAADLANGAVTADKLSSTLDISGKTVTLPNTSVTTGMLAGSIANNKLANSAITINGTSVSLGGSVSAGIIDWQTVKTADFNATAGEGYIVNTTSTDIEITLPASPSIGNTIAIKDYAGTFGTNKVTILRNGKNIQGVANDSQISTNRASLNLVFVDDTKGWVYTVESNVGDLREPIFTTATGGTIATSGDYKIHTFTGDGCFVVATLGNNPANPSGGPNTVSYMIVAGGGGGGTGEANGGGGAGGFREGRDIGPSYTASPLVAPAGLTISATTYPVTVGGGGPIAGKGSDSVFSTITSAGGGGGGPNPQHPGQISKARGGSGSGGGRSSCSPSPRQRNGGAGNTPPTSPPQGNSGGTSVDGSSHEAGGGGGGAGGAGGNAATSAGAGGNGTPTNIIGSDITIASGGGGGTEPKSNPSVNSGPGGSGGGGTGRTGPGVAGSGTANTGGGGGGAGWGPTCGGATNTGGSGGSGRIVIRYKFQ